MHVYSGKRSSTLMWWLIDVKMQFCDWRDKCVLLTKAPRKCGLYHTRYYRYFSVGIFLNLFLLYAVNLLPIIEWAVVNLAVVVNHRSAGINHIRQKSWLLRDGPFINRSNCIVLDSSMAHTSLISLKIFTVCWPVIHFSIIRCTVEWKFPCLCELEE